MGAVTRTVLPLNQMASARAQNPLPQIAAITPQTPLLLLALGPCTFP